MPISDKVTRILSKFGNKAAPVEQGLEQSFSQMERSLQGKPNPQMGRVLTAEEAEIAKDLGMLNTLQNDANYLNNGPASIRGELPPSTSPSIIPNNPNPDLVSGRGVSAPNSHVLDSDNFSIPKEPSAHLGEVIQDVEQSAPKMSSLPEQPIGVLNPAGGQFVSFSGAAQKAEGYNPSMQGFALDPNASFGELSNVKTSRPLSEFGKKGLDWIGRNKIPLGVVGGITGVGAYNYLNNKANSQPQQQGDLPPADPQMVNSYLNGMDWLKQNQQFSPLLEKNEQVEQQAASSEQPQVEQPQVAQLAKATPMGVAGSGAGGGGGPKYQGLKIPQLDFSNTDGFSKADLIDAQRQANQNRLFAELGKAGQTFQNAFMPVGTKADSSFWDAAAKSADQPIEDLKQKLEFAKNDPNSSVSVAARKVLDGMGIKYKGSPSAADLEKVSPMLEKVVSLVEKNNERAFLADQANQNRSMIAEQGRLARQDRIEEMNQRKDSKEEVRQSDLLDKRKAKMIADVNKMYTSGQKTALGLAVGRDMVVDSIDKMLEPYKGDLDKVPEALYKETVAAVSRMITGAAANKYSMSEFSTPTLRSQFSKLYEQASNQTQPAGRSSFLKLMKGISDREKAVGAKFSNAYTNNILHAYKDIGKKDPEWYNETMNMLGSDYGENDKQQMSSQPKIPTQKSSQPQSNSQPSQRVVPIQKLYNADLNKTKFIFQDGSEQIVDGRQ